MMSEREDRRLLKVSIAFIIGLVTIGIIVANIRYLDLGERSQIGGPEIKEIILALIYSLGSIWAIVFVVYLLRRKPSIQAEHQKEQGNNNFLVPLIIVGVLFIAIFAVNQSQPSDQGQPSPNPGIEPGVNNSSNNPVTSDTSGGTGVLYVLIAVLAIGLAIAALRHNRSTPLRLEGARSALARKSANETVRQATADLYAGEEPRSVIVRTYQQMSRLLNQGWRSLNPLTPREVAVLAEHEFGWPEGPLLELTSLFEEAWYSQHAMGEDERDRALKALDAIVSKDKERREIGRANT